MPAQSKVVPLEGEIDLHISPRVTTTLNAAVKAKPRNLVIDMGNVSYLVPSIHPMIQVAPLGTPIHTPDFATWAAGAEGDRAVLDGAKSMAMTVVDLWCEPGLVEAAQSEFERRPAGVEVL